MFEEASPAPENCDGLAGAASAPCEAIANTTIVEANKTDVVFMIKFPPRLKALVKKHPIETRELHNSFRLPSQAIFFNNPAGFGWRVFYAHPGIIFQSEAKTRALTLMAHSRRIQLI